MLAGLPVKSFADAAGMVMAVFLTGRYIEARGQGPGLAGHPQAGRAGRANRAVQLAEGVEKEIPVGATPGRQHHGHQAGREDADRRPRRRRYDERGRVDGDRRVAAGGTTVGDEVIGSTVNGTGLLKVEATRVGGDTFLSQVIRLVEQAQGDKIPIQAFADRVTARFVPVIIVIALATAAAWYFLTPALRPMLVWASGFLPWVDPNLSVVSLAFFAGVAVLVIACPCALGLATPTALMVGSGIGAERGILFRSGEAIQTLKDVRAVVFDKTGTITRGKPAVTDVVPAAGVSRDELLRLAASLEQGSEHPVAGAIVAAAQGLDSTRPTSLQALPGMGVKGAVDGVEVVVGKDALLKECGVDCCRARGYCGRAGRPRTDRPVRRCRGGKVLGVIAVADTVKPDSAQAIADLKALGVTTVMLTGDNRIDCRGGRAEVGIDRVVAEVLPAQKQRAGQGPAEGVRSRGDGRGRHQRRARAQGRPTSASQSAPAPT